MSLIDDKSKINISGYLNERESHTLICLFVNYQRTTKVKHPEKRLFVATEFTIMFFKPKLLVGYSQSKYYNISQIKEIEYTQKNQTLRFLFDDSKSVYINCELIEQVTNKIVDNITNIFTDSELPKIIPNPTLNRNQVSVARRYKYLTFLNNIKRNDTAYEFLKTAFFSSSEFDFTNIAPLVSSHYSLFLDALNIGGVKVLKMPALRQTHWNDLAQFLKKNQTVESVISYEKIDSNFSNVVNVLQNAVTSNVSHFAFYNSGFTSDNIEYIKKIVQCPNIIKLEFNNAFSDSVAINEFNNLILANFANLKTFVVSNTNKINYRYILKSLLELTELNLSGCNLEISDVLKTLGHKQTTSISRLILNDNISEGLYPEKLILPSNISTIDLSSVRWKIQSLTSAIKILMQHQTSEGKFRLGLGNIRLSKEDWNSFYIELNKIQSPTVTEFLWNENTITQDVIQFFNKSNITWLSVTGCLTYHDPILKEMMIYIANSTTLQYLMIGGSQERQLKEDSKFIIMAVGANRSIYSFDIYNQKFGPAVLPELAKALMNNRNVNFVRYTENNITDFEDFISFYKSLQKRGTLLKTVFYPGFRRFQSPKLFELVEQIQKGDPNISIPIECLKQTKTITFADVSTPTELSNKMKKVYQFSNKSDDDSDSSSLDKDSKPKGISFLNSSGNDKLTDSDDDEEEEEEEEEQEKKQKSNKSDDDSDNSISLLPNKNKIIFGDSDSDEEEDDDDDIFAEFTKKKVHHKKKDESKKQKQQQQKDNKAPNSNEVSQKLEIPPLSATPRNGNLPFLRPSVSSTSFTIKDNEYLRLPLKRRDTFEELGLYTQNESFQSSINMMERLRLMNCKIPRVPPVDANQRRQELYERYKIAALNQRFRRFE